MLEAHPILSAIAGFAIFIGILAAIAKMLDYTTGESK